MRLRSAVTGLVLGALLCAAQTSTSTGRPTPTSSSRPSLSSVPTSTSGLVSSASRSSLVSISTVPPNATSTESVASTTDAATTASDPAASAPPSALATLDTHIEPWSGVLGGLLILSGLCLGTTATQLPRTSAAISSIYAGALVVGLLLLKYAVADKLEPPSPTNRGLYLLASVGAGLVAAVPCALFHAAVPPLSGALAGLATSTWLLSTRSDSLIRPVGLRYILIVGLITVGFVLASIQRIRAHILLACTCAIGAFVVVLGVDCFTSAGLKELYVYVLGLDGLFPKLEGHYRLTTAIIAELAATIALVFILMAIQSRFLSIFVKRDAEAKRLQREQAKREEVLARANRRRSRVELTDWEEKYGTGAGSSGSTEERTLLAVDMDKVRSTGSLASLLSVGTPLPAQSRSLDFLPRLGADSPSPASSGATNDFARPPSRPVLASIQPAIAKRESHVSSRSVAVIDPKEAATSKRPSRTLSLFSLGRRSTTGRPPTVKMHPAAGLAAVDDDDDDVPLAAVRSLSTGSLPRPSTMYDLSSVSAPNLTGPGGSTTSLAPPPRSRSRMSLTMPAVLAAPTASPSFAVTAQRPATLARVGIGRSATLLDLNAPSTFDPYHDRARQAKEEASRGPEKIAVGDRRRVNSTSHLEKGKKREMEPVGGGARIMDFGELEEKHRKRLSMLQGTANDKVSSAAALAHFQAQQRAEAEIQRKREGRRSVDSNLHLLSGGGNGRRSASPDQMRKRASASMGSLAGLLRRGSPEGGIDEMGRHSEADPSWVQDAVAFDANAGRRGGQPSASVSSPALHRDLHREVLDRPRRASTQGLVRAPAPTAQFGHQTVQAPLHRPGPVQVRPSTQRRHSLGTLLEVSSSRDEPGPSPVRGGGGGGAGRSGNVQAVSAVSKVAAWRLAGPETPHGRPARGEPRTAGHISERAPVAAGVGEAALLQRVADKAPVAVASSMRKKKHDWLSY